MMETSIGKLQDSTFGEDQEEGDIRAVLKALKEEQEKSKEKIEAIVWQRTADLREILQRTVDLREAAGRAGKRINEIVAVLSHGRNINAGEHVNGSEDDLLVQNKRDSLRKQGRQENLGKELEAARSQQEQEKNDLEAAVRWQKEEDLTDIQRQHRDIGICALADHTATLLKEEQEQKDL